MVKAVLIYPPISDPTSGYHSLCYLDSFARQFGFDDIDIIDSNIESWLYTTRPEQIEKITQFIQERTKLLTSLESLTPFEQMELYYSLKVGGLEFQELLPLAINILRHDKEFYDYSKYSIAVETITLWMDSLSLSAYPGQFRGFSLNTHGFYNVFNSMDMRDSDITDRISAPFHDYFKYELIPNIVNKKYNLAGINITYVAQIPFALSMARLIRETNPSITILFGGTAVSDYWKYILHPDDFFSIFESADACIIGEGESAFVTILQTIERNEPLRPSANVIIHPRHQESSARSSVDIKYENIGSFPTPDYTKLPWEKYLSPFPFIYYSPSRGCYWNRCTFCDYGLNFDAPTSPWRQYPLDKIMDDLRTITASFKYIYFSVDVLSPSLLLKLAEAIITEHLDIRWGAEIRLEEYWTLERCSLLQKSGCVAISVGFESGNQRILNLIDKGTKVDRLQETIQMFSKAGIGVQIMGFTGFPTETIEDALSSIHFLQNNRKYWTFGGLGHFSLTKGAIVAKEPERFGIYDVRPYDGEDIAWRLFYKEQKNPIGISSHYGSKELTKARLSLNESHFDRPWVGGIDSPHTMFYHDRFGTAVIKEIHGVIDLGISKETILLLNGHIIEAPPNIPLHMLFKKKDMQNIHELYEKEGKSLSAQNIDIVLDEMLKEKTVSITRDEPRLHFIRQDGVLFPFSAPMIDFLQAFEKGLSLQELLKDSTQHEFHTKLWQPSLAHRFLRVKPKFAPLSEVRSVAR